MTTSAETVKPDPGSLDPQNTRQRRRKVRLEVCAFAVAAAFTLAACSGSAGTPQGSNPTTPANKPTPVDTGEPGAVGVARGFLDAYGAFDAERAMSYLADDAYLQLDVSTPEELPLLLSFFEAQGYEQIVGSCEEPFSTASGTHVRCPYDFHAIRSDEIGLGPYHGSHWDLTVRDGEIVEVASYFEIERFSPQMWEPFRDWVASEYPKDYEVMYCCGGTNFRLTKQSIRLWEQHTRQYVEIAKGN
jgi:hypothetical protein